MWEELIDKELDRPLWKVKKFSKTWLNPVMARGGAGLRKTRGTRPCRWRGG